MPSKVHFRDETEKITRLPESYLEINFNLDINNQIEFLLNSLKHELTAKGGKKEKKMLKLDFCKQPIQKCRHFFP